MIDRALKLAQAIVSGAGAVEIARQAIGLAVATGIPANQLASYLTQEAVARQNRIADAAEAAKFGP